MIRRIKGAKYLVKPTDPLQIDRDRSVPGLLDKMEKISFQGRNLALAHQIWLQMLQENAVVLMGVGGALVPAGMRRLIAYLIKNRCIDVLVATGANIFHDLHETLGRHHYLGDPKAPDAELLEEKVDRIYDTFASEEEFREAYEWIGGFAAQLDSSHPYSTREFLHLLGRELSEIATEDGILTSAFKSRVPVFCPAITDSAFGVAIGISRIEKKNSGRGRYGPDRLQVTFDRRGLLRRRRGEIFHPAERDGRRNASQHRPRPQIRRAGRDRIG
jgi:deoxyhypusine synthase